MGDHKCHAIGCAMKVPAKMLMCLPHWRRVPEALKQAVWAAYRPGQCADKSPSKEWLKAARAAIQSVREPCPACTRGEYPHRNCILR